MGVDVQAAAVVEKGSDVDVVTRVLVVDDHRTFAELLSRALDAEGDLKCVGYAKDAAEARELVAELHPDIVLMDLEMPDQDGISATAELVRKHPDLKVLILTAHAGEREMARAGAAGASGFSPTCSRHCAMRVEGASSCRLRSSLASPTAQPPGSRPPIRG
jgi:DNA-binding NarL/FixJ family response regulator